MVFPGGSDGKQSACNAGDPGSVPELGKSSGEGNGNPFQYSCLENSMGSQRVRHDWTTNTHIKVLYSLWLIADDSCFKYLSFRDFLGCPVVKALHPSGDMSSIPGLRTKIPHVTWKPKTKQKTDTNKCWQGCGKIESLRHYCGHVCVPVKLLSHIQLCDHMDCQAPLSMEFSKQEYWSGLPCPPPEDLPGSGMEPATLGSPADRFFTTNATWEAPRYC